MMKKLEEKIIKKVYQLETKKTAIDIIIRGAGMMILLLIFILFFSIIVDSLKEQHTLDVLQLFGEDKEVIGAYFFDSLYVIYEELPQYAVIIAVIVLLLFISGGLKIIQNYEKIKNRCRSILRYWLKKKIV